MSEEPIKMGEFMFGIDLILNADGKSERRIKSFMEGIAPEVIIMQMKAYLKELEKGFFKDFNRRNSD